MAVTIMGHIISIHGTFAHEGDTASAWWTEKSEFANELVSLVQAEGGKTTFWPFVWSGDNSQLDRRKAGSALLREFERLEALNEPYCVVAHSHGGSVVSAALLEAAWRKKELPGLKRWITVGTPFVELRRENYLFFRLPILMKALFVASLMLLLMFFVNVFARYWQGTLTLEQMLDGPGFFVGAALTALPFLVFLIFAYLLDRRRLFVHRPRVRRRARDYFASRWLPLTHEDDEAVSGLGTLKTVRWEIFHKTFAVPVLSLLSVFVLPAIYLYVILSPPIMNSLAEFLKQNIYEMQVRQERIQEFDKVNAQRRALRRQIRDTRKRADDPTTPHPDGVAAKNSLKKLRTQMRGLRKQMRQEFPSFAQYRRVSRFRRLFLEQGANGATRLKGNGGDWWVNARLLYHLVTYEATSFVIDDDLRRSVIGRIGRFVIPIILVPLIFAGFAILIVLLVQQFARFVSWLSSRWLNEMTWQEITRSALGNDTEAEVALGANTAPTWADEKRAFLHADLSAMITSHSNSAMNLSLGKFRNAISELTLVDKANGQGEMGAVFAYLNWNELIHMAYFDVPAFRSMLAKAIADCDGFELTEKGRGEPAIQKAAAWLPESAPQVETVA